MGWVLVCALIALVGLAYLVVQAREVWRKVRLLLHEIETAAARAGELTQQPRGSLASDEASPGAGSYSRSAT